MFSLDIHVLCVVSWSKLCKSELCECGLCNVGCSSCVVVGITLKLYIYFVDKCRIDIMMSGVM